MHFTRRGGPTRVRMAHRGIAIPRISLPLCKTGEVHPGPTKFGGPRCCCSGSARTQFEYGQEILAEILERHHLPNKRSKMLAFRGLLLPSSEARSCIELPVWVAGPLSLVMGRGAAPVLTGQVA